MTAAATAEAATQYPVGTGVFIPGYRVFGRVVGYLGGQIDILLDRAINGIDAVLFPPQALEPAEDF